MTELRWGKRRPRREGYYWFKPRPSTHPEDCGSEYMAELIEVYRSAGPCCMTILRYGELKRLSDPFFDRAKWAGPIPAPLEAEDGVEK